MMFSRRVDFDSPVCSKWSGDIDHVQWQGCDPVGHLQIQEQCTEDQGRISETMICINEGGRGEEDRGKQLSCLMSSGVPNRGRGGACGWSIIMSLLSPPI